MSFGSVTVADVLGVDPQVAWVLVLAAAEEVWVEAVVLIVGVAAYFALRQPRSSSPIAASAPRPASTPKPPPATPTEYDPATLAAQVAALGRQKKHSQAIAVYFDLVQPESRVRPHLTEADLEAICMDVARSAHRLDRPNFIRRMIPDMRRLGIPRSAEFYESLMKMFASKRLYDDAVGVYREMAQDMRPSSDACSCLVSFLVEGRNVGAAVELFKTTEPESFQPTIRAYMALLTGLAREGAWQQTLFLISEMPRRGARADTLLLNKALSTCVKAGRVEEAHSLLETMQRRREADVVSVNTVAKGYLSRGDAGAAVAVVEQASAAGVRPNEVTLRTFQDGGDPQSVRQVQQLAPCWGR
mmetsp:Transcript_18749/g.45208  ORF Transcript_18749/g.45208 Transcript_18749/m.45208 type:complete len:358 (-) Transcript_18749:33-1106(-)